MRILPKLTNDKKNFRLEVAIKEQIKNEFATRVQIMDSKITLKSLKSIKPNDDIKRFLGERICKISKYFQQA